MNNSDLILNAINNFPAMRVLVIGDLILDIYLKGHSTRLCPEAPVPVVEVSEREIRLGGAGNTVSNLRALGAAVDFCTVVGSDAEGDEARQLLQKLSVDLQYVLSSPDRKTITKSRIVSNSQVITRVDQGTESELDGDTSRQINRSLEELYDRCDAIIVSDYDKGVITAALLNKLADLQKARPKFLAVDSKRLPYFTGLKPSYAKPNYAEALKILGLNHEIDRAAQLTRYAAELHRRIGSPLITVTLDCDGSMIVENGRASALVPSPRINNPQVSGAGDTYTSAFVLAQLALANARVSADIATAAASIAVSKECTATCSQSELKSYFNLNRKYIADLYDLQHICEAYQQAGKKIVFTNGCFDILHSGHVAYLHRAKQLGDVLIVGLNTDESIKRIKGEERPINGLADRLQVLAGLTSVDHIVPFGDASDDTPVPLIRVVKPHVFVKGGDYTKEKLPEADTVEACGGEIIFIEHVPDHSTTRIINKISRHKHTAPELSAFKS